MKRARICKRTERRREWTARGLGARRVAGELCELEIRCEATLGSADSAQAQQFGSAGRLSPAPHACEKCPCAGPGASTCRHGRHACPKQLPAAPARPAAAWACGACSSCSSLRAPTVHSASHRRPRRAPISKRQASPSRRTQTATARAVSGIAERLQTRRPATTAAARSISSFLSLALVRTALLTKPRAP